MEDILEKFITIYLILMCLVLSCATMQTLSIDTEQNVLKILTDVDGN